MSDPIHALFFCKTLSLVEIKSGQLGRDCDTYEVKVIETKEMTQSDYDSFASNFTLARPWLDGKGGSSIKRSSDSAEEVYLCIAVTTPDRKTLYINPQGYNYARYVGIVII